MESFEFGRMHLNPAWTAAPPLRQMPGWDRVEMTVSCRDCDSIPKVSGAGGVRAEADGTLCQQMHNGIKVAAGAYHGEWMSEIIRRLKGHHEPQEELLFDFVLPFCYEDGPPPLMMELGSFWGYYSLWFRSAYPNGRNILVEPDPQALQAGQKNFELNGFSGEFIDAAVGVHGDAIDFHCESDSVNRTIKTVSVDGLTKDLSIEKIHLLHADIQGAEMKMLEGAAEAINNRRVKWLFLSTHHHSISADPIIHQRCRVWIEARGGQVVAEHTVPESFSGDGLIVALFGGRWTGQVPSISRNIGSRSLFRETEYDLAEAWDEIRRLRESPA